MHVRQANITDARRIAEIHVRSWQSAYRGIMPGAVLDGLSVDDRESLWRRRLSAGGRQTFVIEDAGGVRGWADFGPSRDEDGGSEVEVYGIYLDPAVIRQGHGRRLWSEVCERLRVQQFDRVSVWVLSGNAGARKFYEAMGGQLDAGARKVLTREGLSLPEVRYWCPVGGRVNG